MIAALLANQGYAGAAEDSPKFQLEVFINDAPTKLVGTFSRLSDNRFAATRAELTELGVKPPGSGAAEDLMVLDDIPGITYRYDEPAQKMFLTLGDEQRVTKTYDARGAPAAAPLTPPGYGAVVNYTLFAASQKQLGSGLTFSGANATFDSRVFSPFGTLSQTAIVGSTVAKDFDALRLDTTWAYSDPSNVLTYRAGDMISGGLAWTRPIRIGGVQVQRNFAIRPDLVTMPLPTVGGSAAVPSTVDVFVNNLKTYSQEVGSGPYQINNLPMMTGGGDARIVLNDASGRTVETSVPFYASPKLLREDLWDFSVEAGLPRLQYGIQSFDYVLDPVASASVRRGLYDWLTLEAHVEGGAGLVNGGAGVVARVGSWGALSVAGAASRFQDAFGFQTYVAFDTQLWQFNIHASSQRTFGTYNDLASVTALALPPPTAPTPTLPTDSPLYSSNAAIYSTSFFPPKFLDTITMTFPLPLKLGSMGVGFLHLGTTDGKRSDIVNLSYSRPLIYDASLFVSAFFDLKDKKTAGIFAGLSIPLGKSTSASTGVSMTRQGATAVSDASKSIQPEVGSYGWRIQDSEGATTYRSVTGSYRASMAQVEGQAWQSSGSAAGGSVTAQGAISTMGGGVFLSNRIDDSFAVVDVGAPNVDVLYENRAAGKTNAQGQVLIPTLRAYQPNNIAIDPKGLPLDADVSTTQSTVTPADRTGVLVRFGVKTGIQSAIVVFGDKSGKFLPAGTSGKLDGAEEPFVVGYDGKAYVKGLAETNGAVLTVAGGECRASFPYAAQKDTQVVIGPVTCE